MCVVVKVFNKCHVYFSVLVTINLPGGLNLGQIFKACTKNIYWICTGLDNLLTIYHLEGKSAPLALYKILEAWQDKG